jgi:outer membrane protein insertion porin family
MKKSVPPRIVARLLLVALCVWLAGFAGGLARVSAQALLAPTGPIVREIDVQYAGKPTISRERILANMRTTVGQPFSQTGAEDDIRNLYKTGEITNVRIFSEPLPNGVKVIVIVQTRSTIKAIIINGATKTATRKLLGQITSKKNKVLNEETLEQDRQKIEDYYHDRGFQNVDVKSAVAMDEKDNTATITFTVNQGERGVLRSVRFEGNQHVKSRDLRFAMKGTRGKTIISWIDKTGRLDQSKLHEDLDSIRDLYQSKGYIDVDIPETRVEKLTNGDLNLVVVIHEGVQYHLGTLSFDGTQIFTPAEIRRFLKMKENAIYSPKGLKDDVKTIQDYYGSRGYVDAHVTPEATPSGPGKVNLTYKIEEGGQSFVDRVNIAGNSVTQDKVIRREMPVAPGDVFNTVLVDTGKKRLENLGYFEKVDATPEDTDVADRKDLDILVQEKRTGSLSFGAGFSSIDSLLGQIELTQSNFDITNFPNFTGGGQRFRLLLQYGLIRKDLVLSLTEPYFLNTHLAVGGEIFYHDTDYLSNDYDQQNLGFDVNVRRGITRFTAASLEYRFETIDINNVNSNSTILEQEVGSRTRSALRADLSYDTRDSVFLTRRGDRVDISPYIAGGPLGGQTNIAGLDITGAHYVALPLDGILLFNGEIAGVTTIDGGDRVPVYDRLYLGGANNLRGYGFREVGPKDYKGNPVGGRSMARVTAEYTYPIINRVRGAFFYDGGFVNQQGFDFVPETYHSRSDFSSDPNRVSDNPRIPKPNAGGSDATNIEFGGGLNMDIGLGVRLDLPIGPVRLDYGVPLLYDDFDHRKLGKFNFNVGYQF